MIYHDKNTNKKIRPAYSSVIQALRRPRMDYFAARTYYKQLFKEVKNE